MCIRDSYVIDDVHWADVASLEALRALLPLVERRPVLFLFAMRPDWSTPGWHLYVEAQLELSLIHISEPTRPY